MAADDDDDDDDDNNNSSPSRYSHQSSAYLYEYHPGGQTSFAVTVNNAEP